MLYTNADCLSNKMIHLELATTHYNPDIIGVTEVHPKNTPLRLCDTDVKLDNYTVFTNLTDDGRGVALYVRNDIYARSIQSTSYYRDSVWIEISTPGVGNMRVGCVYRSNSNDELTNTRLLHHIEKMVKDTPASTELIVMGDFNLRSINWDTQTCGDEGRRKAQNFLDMTLDLGLHQHVREPTRFRAGQIPSTLDLILTKNPESIQTIVYDTPLAKSDHVVIVADVVTKMQCKDPVMRQPRFVYERANFEGFRTDLEARNLTEDLASLGAEDGWNLVQKTLKDLISKHVPRTRPGPNARKNFKPLWTNPRAIGKVKAKRDAWKRFLTSKSGEDYERYIRERNAARKEVKKAVKTFEKAMAKKSKTDPKAFWRYAKSKTSTKTDIKQLRCNGTVVFTNTEKAELLNSFFSSVFTEENTDEVPVSEVDPNMRDIENPEFTRDAVLKKLKELKVNKAPGPDEIPAVILKEMAEELAEPLRVVFQKSVDSGIVPEQWKKAHVTPILKKGDQSLPSNYRPISLTCIACKLLESLMKDHIDHHMKVNNLATKSQYGFTCGRSTKTNLIDCMEEWTKALDDKVGIDVIYLDFRKAFDSVPHQRLLVKLDSYGIRGTTQSWIKSFLSDRTQSVVLGGCISSCVNVTSGVPQGSVLGPCLFNIYVNDLPEQPVVSDLPMFADDGKLYKTIRNVRDCIELQGDLDRLSPWAAKWQLGFNETKCNVLRVGRNLPDFTYHMTKANGERIPLERVNETKDLGVTIDESLSVKGHIDRVTASATRVLFSIKRSLRHLNQHSGPMLYQALVRPILEYGNSAWSPATLTQARQLEKIQRRATRWILRHSNLTYEERLRRLKMPSLYYRRTRGDLIQTFQHLNSPELFNNLKMELSTRRGRGHRFKLAKPRARTTIRSNCLALRVVNLWNSLPERVVESANTDQFKRRVDDWARGSGLFFSIQ